MSAICPLCGQSVEFGHEACPNCREPLQAAPQPKRRTITLIECLVVVAILVILVAIFTPASRSSRGAGRRSHSKNNLKQMGLALHNYHEKHLMFPPGGIYSGKVGHHGWMTNLLPQLDYEPLFITINFSVPYDDPANAAVFTQTLPCFINPGITSEPNTNKLGLAHYTANSRLLSKNSTTQIEDIADGTASTILAGEVRHKLPDWGAPDNFRDPALGINRAPNGFGGPFKGGANVLMADGAVRFVSENVSPETMKRLANPADGQPVGEF